MSDDATAAIASIINSQYVQNCCNFAAFTIYLYDHAITLGDQIDHIWRRRFSAVTTVFALLHLSTIAVYVLYIVLVPLTECEPYVFLHRTTGVLMSFTIGAIAALRVYAINGRDVRLPTLILSLTLMTAAGNAYYSASLATEMLPPPINSCTIYPVNLALYVNTWWNTYGLKKLARETDQGVSLTHLILRDGTIYFIVLLLLEVISAIGQYVAALAGVPAFTFALETVVLSRFLLDLRQAALRLTINPGPGRIRNTSSSSSGSIASLTEIQFNSHILGSLGGSLAFGFSNDGYPESTDESTETERSEDVMDIVEVLL
ncbi:hypothetical protein DAEQUDRAFT_770902 [Daedalea quercina L-15889]|uniref:DUF6533 domain-containing protein n=1 Tax=Daedalea quercina L-15889 TaxID=1314783 RepID=A0A165KGV9_9APHY|nr:hypothetical protein DAEQUDRAFT_770902 [Daedalea quercina L-15889]